MQGVGSMGPWRLSERARSSPQVFRRPVVPLLARADPPDPAANIVGDEEGAVAGDRDSDRPAHGPLLRLVDEAGEHVEGLARRLAVLQPEEAHLVAGERTAVPGTVQTDEDAVGI